jgi:predicted short-subunit dehydrogenase-like oxidoreductase (DUF2520 family)
MAEVVYRHDRKRAEMIARRCGGNAVRFEDASFTGDVMWLCVGDNEIAATAKAMSKRGGWKGKYVFHASGALSSVELRSLKAAGAKVASVHPMMSFVRTAEATFRGVMFALEGDGQAVRFAAEMAKVLGGTSFLLKTSDKPLYHAMGAFSSPLLVAHLATTEKIGKKLGLPPERTRRLIAPILQKTLQNYLEHGPAAALSGPMTRGDVETLRRNLEALKRVDGAREIFRVLAKMAANELPVKNKAAIRKLLAD